MNRYELDTFAQHYALSPAAIEASLHLTGNRLTLDGWRQFAQPLLKNLGIGAISAGVIFFIAANWQAYGVMAHFLLLQIALLFSAGIALWYPPPHRVGQSALLVGTLLIGALLALFGQTYQTGADIYELFFFWVLLALPFAVAGLSGAIWMIWWMILNIALALYIGVLGNGQAGLYIFGLRTSIGILFLSVVNVLAALAYFKLSKFSRFSKAAPSWLIHTLQVLGAVYGTCACIGAIDEFRRNSDIYIRVQSGFVLLSFAGICFLVGRKVLEYKKDVFTMALITASAIIISTTALAERISFSNIGSFFALALWLIASSTGASLLLMHWVRKWRTASSKV